MDALADRLEHKRSSLLHRVGAMDPDLRTGHLREGKWSVLEIVEHLVRAEEDVCIDMGALPSLGARPRRLKNRLGYLVVMFVLRFDIPVAAPSEAMLPTGSASLPELRTRWEANHRRLLDFVAGLDGTAAERAIFHHPIAGPLTVKQGMRMIEVHLDRHIRQIATLERLYRERAGPSLPA